jgi:hypothetical protein
MGQQRPVAAAQIQHARLGLHPLRDTGKITA